MCRDVPPVRGVLPRDGRHGRMRKAGTVAIGVAATVLVAVCTPPLAAHDFWIIPDVFAVTPGGRISARGQTSSLFPTSLSAVAPDRIAEARILTAASEEAIRNAAVTGASLVIGHRPSGKGQHVIGVRLGARNVRESPASFRHYLDLEGALEARERYERAGLLPPLGGDSVTRRYAKYAKSFVEVGRGARAFSRAFGHPLEFVPLSDPASLRSGDTLRVRLMLLGKPASSARFTAGSAPAGTAVMTDTTGARRAAASDVVVETDSTGVATVAVDRAGLWNVRTIQIVPAATGSGADWDVHWATMVFQVTRR